MSQWQEFLVKHIEMCSLTGQLLDQILDRYCDSGTRQHYGHGDVSIERTASLTDLGQWNNVTL